MKPARFELCSPTSIAEVVAVLAEHGDEAKVLAGGQSLVPMLALRLARFERLIDVNGVHALTGVSTTAGEVRVGALTRHRTLESDPRIVDGSPLLALATRRVGHVQIRNRGTLGGAIAHGDSAAEQPAVALALDATMEATSVRGTRSIAAADFFQGIWTTALAADELLTAVTFPIWEGACGFAVHEVARRVGDFALAGVVCGIAVDAGGEVIRAAIGLLGVGRTPVRASAAEKALLAGCSLEEVGAAAMGEVDPIDDLHATAKYRRQVTGVLVRRAVDEAKRKATNG